MNISHRTLWNPSLGAWVAVSEITAARGKRSGGASLTAVAGGVLALTFVLGSAPALAGGDGGNSGAQFGLGATGGGTGTGGAGGAGNGGSGGTGGGIGANGGVGSDGNLVGSVGGGGGGGGTGVLITTNGSTNTVAVAGGSGGDGGEGIRGGGGGGGGAGAVAATGLTGFTNSGSLTGGNGGSGGEGTHGGSGGGGGAGAVAATGLASFTNSGSITGGNGGNGGFAFITAGTANGGNGGAGVAAAGLTGFTNSGSITGGNGGGSTSLVFGNGGNGGNGEGGAAGATSAPTFRQGGAGVIGSNLSITNAGSISGGLSAGNVRANAITFTGGSNTLTLQTGSVLTGAVEIGSGATALIVADNGGLAFGNLLLGGNATVHTTGNTLTASGVISGAGSLSKTSIGNLILTSANSFTGGTTLNAGVLTLGNNTALGTGGLTVAGASTLSSSTAVTANNDVTLNANLTIASANALRLDGNITGGSGLIKTGASSLTLGGTNNFSGAVALNAGMLILASNTALGTGTLNAAGGTTLDAATAVTANNNVNLGGNLSIGGSADLILAGTVSGIGSLTKNGSANLTLGGASNFAGNVTLNAGTLTAGSNTALGTGALLVSGNSTLGNTAAVSLGNAVALNANLTVAATSNMTLGGVINGAGGLTKTGTGTLILSGNSTYNGATSVNAGTLSVNGSITNSAVTVNNGGTLSGNGTLGNTTIASGGVLAPGNSIGTLTVNGNLSFAAGSIYRVEVDAAGANDRINATGTATISGGTVDVQASAGTYAANTQYTILNAAGGRTGNFAGVTSNLAFLTPTLGYDANNVFLTLARNDISFSAVAVTPNQIATSTALQNANAGVTGDMSSVQTALTGLSAVQARAAYDSASGAGAVALRRAGAGLAAGFGNQLQARLGAQANAANGFANSFTSRPVLLAANDHLSDLMAPVSDSAPQKFSLGSGTASLSSSPDAASKGFWVRGNGGYGTTDSDGNASASRLRSSGLSVGFDAEVNNGVRIGVAATGGTSRLSTDNNESGKTRSSALAVYGSYANGPWNFSGSASLGWGKNHLDRNVTIGALTRVASSDFDSSTLAAYGEASYAIAMSGWTLQPLAGLSLSRNKADGFTETGAGALNLQVAEQTVNSSKAMLGAKASFDTGRIRIEPRVIWAHEFGDLNTPMTAQFQGAATASPFQVSGATLKRDTLILGLGAAGSISKGIDLFADVQAEHNSAQRNLAVLVGLRSRW